MLVEINFKESRPTLDSQLKSDILSSYCVLNAARVRSTVFMKHRVYDTQERCPFTERYLVSHGECSTIDCSPSKTTFTELLSMSLPADFGLRGSAGFAPELCRLRFVYYLGS